MPIHTGIRCPEPVIDAWLCHLRAASGDGYLSKDDCWCAMPGRDLFLSLGGGNLTCVPGLPHLRAWITSLACLDHIEKFTVIASQNVLFFRFTDLS